MVSFNKQDVSLFVKIAAMETLQTFAMAVVIVAIIVAIIVFPPIVGDFVKQHVAYIVAITLPIVAISGILLSSIREYKRQKLNQKHLRFK